MVEFVVYLPLLVSLVGLAIYMLIEPPAHPKMFVISMHMFWVGLLAFLLTFHGSLR